MRYASVCSGIEAPTVAWHPLEWSPVFFSEIDPFPCAVLAHHYPTVPNLGDMLRFKEWPDANFDVLVGGTPCQSFSVAGLREGLADPRGNLLLTYLAIAERYRPRWLVWENVPGVLSSGGGRDFGTLLGGMAKLGYGFAYRILDAQYIRVEPHARAIPQRRRRVFVVGCLGDWRSAAAVLLERESLQGHPAPRREAGKGITHPIANCLTNSGRGVERNGDTRGQDPVVAVAGTINPGAHPGGYNGQDAYNGNLIAFGGNNQSGEIAVSTAINAKGGSGRMDFETETLVAHSLRAAGIEASEDGTGRGTPLIPILGFDCKASGRNGFGIGEISPTLRAMGHKDSHSNAGGLRAALQQAKVRRLTPVECERLQGYPDGYTDILYRNKPSKDGPRYKALGNSMATNVVNWIGQRIDAVDNR